MTQLSIPALQEEARQSLLGRGFSHVGGSVYTGNMAGGTDMLDTVLKKRVRTKNGVITARITDRPGMNSMETFLLLHPESTGDDYPTQNGEPNEYNCVVIEYENNPESRWLAEPNV